MKQSRNVSLQRFNTFGVPATASRVTQLSRVEDLAGCTFMPGRDLVLGGGSNLLLAGDIEGNVFLNRMAGMRLLEDSHEGALVECASGELWHSMVLWSLAHGLSGLENLSLIPGLVGAAPIQNIGAYGVELSDVLVSVGCWDWLAGEPVELTAEDCRLGYRTSRFKTDDADRFLVTSIRMNLARRFQPRLEYAGIEEQLGAMGVSEVSADLVSRAVIALRKRKLPDPALIGNAGSFFKNPAVTADLADTLKADFPTLPAYPAGDGRYKLSAAWMIDHCGWKGHRAGDAGVSDQHALVLINHGTASGRELLELARRVAASVQNRFGVALEPEPVIVGAPWRERPDS